MNSEKRGKLQGISPAQRGFKSLSVHRSTIIDQLVKVDRIISGYRVVDHVMKYGFCPSCRRIGSDYEGEIAEKRMNS